MYPLPRILIAAAGFGGIGYGIVALIFLLPTHQGMLLYYLGFPALGVLVALGIAIFAGGEPSDETSVHRPRMTDAEPATESQPVHHARGRDATGRPILDPAHGEQDFIELVRQAIDELPPEFAQALAHVGVVVSDQGAVQRINGRRQPLYGLYMGYGGRSSYLIGAPVRSALPDRIVIFRDTLVHDYGNDPTRLRQEVTRTLRHELAHHLGWDEPGVHALGL
jgi:predicted Zn-dependent protease with MMP-like domain